MREKGREGGKYERGGGWIIGSSSSRSKSVIEAVRSGSRIGGKSSKGEGRVKRLESRNFLYALFYTFR